MGVGSAHWRLRRLALPRSAHAPRDGLPVDAARTLRVHPRVYRIHQAQQPPERHAEHALVHGRQAVASCIVCGRQVAVHAAQSCGPGERRRWGHREALVQDRVGHHGARRGIVAHAGVARRRLGLLPLALLPLEVEILVHTEPLELRVHLPPFYAVRLPRRFLG